MHMPNDIMESLLTSFSLIPNFVFVSNSCAELYDKTQMMD